MFRPSRIGVGNALQAIANHARQMQCNQTFMGTRSLQPVSNSVVGSPATWVIYLTDVRVFPIQPKIAHRSIIALRQTVRFSES
jgi:nucleotide-binding universal stress UspA family protein